ncbi:MAG: hypothetical protein H0X33_13485 [Taibaiella sp.]|nr:hypothetical protein [Taibaiella sp.]
MEMLASWSKTKTIQELIEEAFFIRQAIIRFLARENKQGKLVHPLNQVVCILMNFHARASTAVSGENEEVEGQNQLGEKIIRQVRIGLAESGIDIDRLIEEWKRDNQPKTSQGQDPWL